VKVVLAQCDLPEVHYLAEKIELPQSMGLKPADIEAVLDYWQGDLANEFNGKVLAQKKLRLDSGAYGRDFTLEGRPEAKGGLATIRARMYLSQRVLYILAASSKPDADLPEDVAHFFASQRRHQAHQEVRAKARGRRQAAGRVGDADRP
jgi:hypothetical protein